MTTSERIGIVGTGATGIYVLKHLLGQQLRLSGHVQQIQIFERDEMPGMGMPYHPNTTDIHHLCNISSREIPQMSESLVNWLKAQPPARLDDWGIRKETVDADSLYPRLVLGAYLRAQFHDLCSRLRGLGFEVVIRSACDIVDIVQTPGQHSVTLMAADGTRHEVERVFMCTGHAWPHNEDLPDAGYFASPWPISKVLPQSGELYNCSIGLLGASLSAFDVVSSLAHRHGELIESEGMLHFVRRPGCESFKLHLHSKTGRLPHLQFEQDRPLREIYRHVRREELLNLRTSQGWLRLGDYFDVVCRPLLAKAFREDGRGDVADSLSDLHEYSLEDFVQQMTVEHEYSDPFEGVRMELKRARRMGERPFHWKEILDDLMYTLNFHAQLLPAEDHRTLHRIIMPFLLNVVAAMPLESAKILLALREANCIEVVEGDVAEVHPDVGSGGTVVKITHQRAESELAYTLFIDCSGQKRVEIEHYPFPSLVELGRVREAQAKFAKPPSADVSEDSRVSQIKGEPVYSIGGIEVDETYRIVGKDGQPNPRVYELSFPQTAGVRPYSYGLQACNETAGLAVAAMIEGALLG